MYNNEGLSVIILLVTLQEIKKQKPYHYIKKVLKWVCDVFLYDLTIQTAELNKNYNNKRVIHKTA